MDCASPRALVSIVAGLSVLTFACSDPSPTGIAQSGGLAVNVTLLKTSLVDTIAGVRIRVEQNGAVIHADTTSVSEGRFQFEALEVPAGSLDVCAEAFDLDGRPLYRAETTARAVACMRTEIELRLLPCVPMVRLAPYHAIAVVGDTVSCALQLWNISRFIIGVFEVTFDTNRVAIEQIYLCKDTAWGDFVLVSPTLSPGATLQFVVLRVPPGPSDEVPPGLCDLVFLKVVTRSPGETRLTLHVPSLGDSDGMVQEWDELCCDHQILDIRPPTPVGDYEAVLEE